MKPRLWLLPAAHEKPNSHILSSHNGQAQKSLLSCTRTFRSYFAGVYQVFRAFYGVQESFSHLSDLVNKLYILFPHRSLFVSLFTCLLLDRYGRWLSCCLIFLPLQSFIFLRAYWVGDWPGARTVWTDGSTDVLGDEMEVG